jgi:aspartate aminotransferase
MLARNPVATRIAGIKPPAVSALLEQASAIEAGGTQLTYLLRGEPDFDTPAHICAAATEALQLGHTHYPPARGIRQLRRAVADRMQRDFGSSFDADAEILVTAGATEGMYIALHAVVESGDEVILFEPGYDPYPSAVRLAGGVPVLVAAQNRGGRMTFHPDDVIRALTRKTKAMVLCNPWNPTGTVMTRPELATLVDIATAHDLVLIADEIYEKIVFDGVPHINLASMSREARARTITVNSFSKSYAMTGWRIGYNLAPSALTQAMLRVQQQLSRSAATFVQHAGTAALNGPQEAVSAMLQQYKARRQVIIDAFSQDNRFELCSPQGTFFAFLSIRQFGMSSEAMAHYLMEHARVVTVPGSVYGPSGEGHIRLSFACNEGVLRQGVEAIVDGLRVR